MNEYNGHYYHESRSTGETECSNCGTIVHGWEHSFIEDTSARKKFCCLRCFREYADMHPRDSSVGSCFITTATIKSRNLPDDCHELTSLRNFRDSFMKKDELMNAEVEEYYEIAPTICENIDKQENASEIYEEIYQKWIKDAVESCDNGDKQKAHDIYKSMVLNLKKRYL